MTTKAEWLAAVRLLNADERERLGPLPEYEVWEAFFLGTLDEVTTERVRAHIACRPDFVRAVAMHFPEAGESVTPDELRARWERLQEAIADTTLDVGGEPSESNGHVERKTELRDGKTFCSCGNPWPCQALSPVKAETRTEFSLLYFKDRDGKPQWFRGMTGIGPELTIVPSEAARFESVQAAMKSPAFAWATCPLDAVPAPDVALAAAMNQLREDCREGGELASELAGKRPPTTD